MRYRLARPAVLVDINEIDDLDYVRQHNGTTGIGARTRDVAVERSPVFAGHPLIADACAVVADPVVREMGTLVGSLCHNDPAGDWPVVALAARAQVIARGRGGGRTIAIDDFLVDSFTTALKDDELALEVCFPSIGERTSGAYYKIERKVGDFATSAAAVQLTLAPNGTISAAGVAIGAAGPTARRVEEAERLLTGATPSDEIVRAAADAAKKAADPIADTRGSSKFKKELAGVLVARALAKTLGRLGVGGFQA